MTLVDPVLDRFRSSFVGEIIAPGQSDYDSARLVWSALYDRRPRLVVRPESVAEKLERLVAVKRAWDPDNVFRTNHNIRPQEAGDPT